jgi:predicted acyltransferase
MANEAVSQAVVAGPTVLIPGQAEADGVVSSAMKAAPSPVRLASLDALRGFDMFWIIGADQVLRAVAANTHSRILAGLASQFEHVPWAGFHFYDLIFPLFLFMIGVSIPYSFSKRLRRGDTKGKIYAHVFTRVAILVFMGMMVNGRILSYDPSKLEATYSVLQVLALGYLVATLMVLNMNLRWQIATTAAMLIVYWALMDFVPVPGHVVGVYKPGANFGDWLNDLIVGRFQGIWRFGWILQTLTNGSSAMLGVFAGQLLRSQKSARQKLLWLTWLGLGCLVAGLVWSIWFPIIKDRWTSTFALFAGGWSYLLLALFYFVIDFRGHRKWAFPFIVIGMNAIVAYMAANLFGHAFRLMAEVFVGGLRLYVGGWYEAIASLGGLITLWLMLYWLYRNRTFIKV